MARVKTKRELGKEDIRRLIQEYRETIEAGGNPDDWEGPEHGNGSCGSKSDRSHL